MLLTIFTAFHVLISLIAILTGLVVAGGMLRSKPLPRMTLIFLATTVATSITGFLFPVHHFMPSHGAGIISLILLAVAIYSRYRGKLARLWRPAYVVAATLSLYLNMFVLVVQGFMKVPALKALAPTQSEPPFKIAQAGLLSLFLILIAVELFKFRSCDSNSPPQQADGRKGND